MDYTQFEGHTPGSWEANAENCGDGLNVVSESGLLVAHTAVGRDKTGTRIFSDEAKANARLIAAAPDLLADNAQLRAENERLRAALGWIVEFCDEHPEWTENELCNGRDDSAEAEWLAEARAAMGKGAA